MVNLGSHAPRRIAGYSFLAACLVLVTAIAVVVATQSGAGAATTVGLGTASSFGVLASSTVTNVPTPPNPRTVINGDLGVSPGTAVTGFPPGRVTPPGAIHTADAVAGQAQVDLTTAYNNAASAGPGTDIGAAIAGDTTLGPGVYTASAALGVGGTLTLNGGPSDVWIFQVGSALTTAPGTSVVLTGGASACNVFWQVGSSATLDTGNNFTGTIMAQASISVLTGDTIQGRALARTGAVTLDHDTITVPTCPGSTSPPVPPTRTPRPPRPSPTRTGPGPQPSPTRTGPGPQPSPTRTGPGPKPSPTRTGPGPKPSPTRTGPSPKPTRPAPKPSPTAPAPVPTPIPTTIPVTG